jgi:hypothetical protein
MTATTPAPPASGCWAGGHSGYIRLWRSLFDNPVWTQLSPAVLKVMIAFLLKANWKPATWYDGSTEVEIPRGSFITSYPKIAEFCQLSVKQARSSFLHLENLHFAAYTRAAKWTMVTVLNYETYQGCADDEGTVEGNLRARSGQDEGTMRAPIEEVKKLRTNTRAPKADALAVGNPLSIDDPPFSTLDPDGLFPDELPQKRNPCAELEEQQRAWFAEWWATYWLHRAKKPAAEAFRKAVKTEARFREVLGATKAQAAEMLSREPAKRPYGATWLRAERWEDEMEPTSPRPATADDYPELDV